MLSRKPLIALILILSSQNCAHGNHLFELDMENLEMETTYSKPKEIKKEAKFVQSNALRIWTETIGNANNPAVVLICGAGAHAGFWTNGFCEQIAKKGYFVIRFDHRDCGLSSTVDFNINPYTVKDLTQDVLAILNAYAIKKAHVVGHSMGGIIAQLLAINSPDRLLSFISMSVATVGKTFTPSKETMDILLENRPNQVYEESLEGFMKSWEILNGDFPLDHQMATSYTKEMYERSIHPVGVASNHIQCQKEVGDLSKELGNVVIPSLFIHGEKDPLIPVRGGISTAEAVTNAKLKVIPGMGHMLFNSELQKIIAIHLINHFQKSKN